MELFKLENNKVVVNPETLLIKEFKTLWTRDRSKSKEAALAELAYVFFLCDWNSPYKNISEEDRHESLKEELDLGPTWEPDHDVKLAMSRYEKLQETPTMKYAKSVSKAFWDMVEYFQNIDYKERDSRGKPIYDINTVTKAMADSGKLIDTVKRLEVIVKKEQLESSRVRAGDELGAFEDPDNEI